jgi:hypothetical protein
MLVSFDRLSSDSVRWCMFNRRRQRWPIRLVCAAVLTSSVALAVGAADSPGAAPQGESVAPQPGRWQPHSYDFHFMGFTSTYSCDGLADKLQLLLRLAGASPDARVMPLCVRGSGVPDKLVQASVKFSTLQPADASAAGAAAAAPTSVDGVWRHVELAPRRPFELGPGDCELVEQFRDTLLPMFTTRNVNNQVTCVPHQESGSNFSLGFDVYAPPPPPAKGKPAKGAPAKGA